MDVLTIVVLIFLVLECLNVFMLYFIPETKKGNGVGVFDAYEKSKKDPEVHALIKYLINWIAGTKIIFISLLIIIIIKGDNELITLSILALIGSILTFYWRLYPMIRQMDLANQISPKGYSRVLGLMIAGFILVFSMTLVYSKI